jgi:hypothetical protein
MYWVLMFAFLLLISPFFVTSLEFQGNFKGYFTTDTTWANKGEV